MNRLSNYMNFLIKHGRPLSEINPGSDEIALNLDNTLQAIELLQEAQLPILGGDILSDDSGKLIYTYENWYCEKLEHENHNEYCLRSYNTTKIYLNNIIKKTTKIVMLSLLSEIKLPLRKKGNYLRCCVKKFKNT